MWLFFDFSMIVAMIANVALIFDRLYRLIFGIEEEFE